MKEGNDNTDNENPNDSESSQPTTSRTFALGTRQLEVSDQQTPYYLISLASTILLIAVFGADISQAYGLAVAIVSLVFSIVALFLSYKMKDKWDSFGIYIAYFLLLWNAIAAIVLTFHGPFISTTNGYFAVWAMVVFSVMAAKLSVTALQEKLKNSDAIAGLLMSSIVLTVALIFIGLSSWRSIYSLIVSILTIVVCTIFIYLDFKVEGQDNVRFPILAVFTVLWLVAVIILTFSAGVFPVTGNGFFATWVGFILCAYAASKSKN